MSINEATPEEWDHAYKRQIGRASCRERVKIAVVAGTLKKKTEKKKKVRKKQ